MVSPELLSGTAACHKLNLLMEPGEAPGRSVGSLACPLFAGIHGVIIRELFGRAALGTGIETCPVFVPSQSWRFHSF